MFAYIIIKHGPVFFNEIGNRQVIWTFWEALAAVAAFIDGFDGILGKSYRDGGSQPSGNRPEAHNFRNFDPLLAGHTIAAAMTESLSKFGSHLLDFLIILLAKRTR